jgi:hypothetical protein
LEPADRSERATKGSIKPFLSNKRNVAEENAAQKPMHARYGACV